jgi:hypothetical protein
MITTTPIIEYRNFVANRPTFIIEASTYHETRNQRRAPDARRIDARLTEAR